MGKRHYQYGVAAGQYEPMKQALLLTLRESQGEAFPPQLAEAWSEAYDLMAQVMIEGEEHMRARIAG